MVGIVGSSHGGYSRVLPWWVGYSHLPMVGRLLPSAHGGYIPPARGGYIPPARGGCTFLHPGVEKVLIPAHFLPGLGLKQGLFSSHSTRSGA